VLFNSALASEASGEVVDRYDKRYLLAFGEYLPLGDVWPVLHEWSPNSGRFTRGTRIEPIEVTGRSIAVLICYEDIIPSYVNTIMTGGSPELIVNLTNDAWFGDTTEPWIHLALAKFRAVEHRRYLVRSVNSGVSAFVDPVGRVTGHTQTFVEASLKRQIAWLDGSPPYGWMGDLPWWIVSALALAGAFVPRRQSRTSTDRASNA
jgi:apolipoprotein N-acyltransferase